VMGLVWAIMQKFLKFGDDEDGENLSAEDSLLMWVQNQLLTYSDIEVKSFTKSFHNGLAYAALIHKFRPNLIDPAQLNAGDALGNLAKVFEAAKTYFELEQYIEPSDISQLDSKSAFIFLSEFYYGIAKQRKVDLACRRITKLIHYTQKNDELRARYQEKANLFLDTLAKVTVELNDRTIDNTMSGAQARLAAFQAYKGGDKITIVDAFLSIESLYNHLSMRLADHNRPVYAPGANKAVPELREALKVLEATELERQVALVKELNRQIRLKQLDEQHQTKHKNLAEWQAKHEAILKTEEVIESIGQAEYEINRVKNFTSESTMVRETTELDMKQLGQTLESESFEFVAQVKAREQEVDAKHAELSGFKDEKAKVLDAALKKELEKERLRLKFANAASEFARYVESQSELLESSHFGFSLDEVEAYKAKLEETCQKIENTSSSQFDSIKQTHEEATALGVTENKYTRYSLIQLEELMSKLAANQQAHKVHYEQELVRWRKNDALCKSYAQKVNELVTRFDTDKAGMANSTESLEVQLASVESKLREVDTINSATDDIAAVQAEIEAAGVQNNPHSHYTKQDVEVLKQQFMSFLERKAEQLKDEIEHKALRGLTPEQHEEIEVQFKTFDKDSSGVLSKSEFKSCLYSLGEDKTSSQIAEVMEKYGSVLEGIAHKGFKDFMIEQLGDTDTSEEIVDGFELINKAALINVERMQQASFHQQEVDYILETAPKVDNGYDYKVWTASVFAR